MMQRRTLRITAWILLFIISTIVVEGYDVLSGREYNADVYRADQRVLRLRTNHFKPKLVTSRMKASISA